MEGRAARRRLPALLLGGADGDLAADAVIAVSRGMRADVLDAYPGWTRPGCTWSATASTPMSTGRRADPDVLRPLGVDPDRPSRFRRPDHPPEGRAAPARGRQAAAADPAAGALRRRSRHPRDAAEVADAVAELRRGARRRRLDRGDAAARQSPLISGADGFVCPVGVRAARHRQPGGDGLRDRRRGQRGRRHPRGGGRRPHRPAGAYDPADPAAFEAGLAARIAELLDQPARAAAMGAAGRERVLAEFGWPAIAQQTVGVYNAVLDSRA